MCSRNVKQLKVGKTFPRILSFKIFVFIWSDFWLEASRSLEGKTAQPIPPKRTPVLTAFQGNTVSSIF